MSQVGFSEEQLATVKGIYLRPHGKYEAVLYHPTLPKNGTSQVFPGTDQGKRDAAIWKLNEKARLDAQAKRVAPQGLQPAPAVTIGANMALHAKRPTHLAAILKEYRENGKNLSRSAKLGLDYLRNEEALDIRFDQITTEWVEALVESYKTGAGGVRRIRPQTIRKKVDYLRKATNWYFITYWVKAGINKPENPFDNLEPNYCSYEVDDPNKLENEERSRRLRAGEEAAVLDVIWNRRQRRCLRKFGEGRSAWAPSLEVATLWLLLVHTGLRLREAYRLRMKHISFADMTIFVADSKLSYKSRTTGQRTVPILTVELVKLLKHYVQAKGLTMGSEEPLFACWWNGTTKVEELAEITNKLSQMFAALHEDAGAPDLRTHDLRHEAICRFCEMRLPDGRRRFEKRDVMAISGHTVERTFAIYAHYFVGDMVPDEVRALAA